MHSRTQDDDPRRLLSLFLTICNQAMAANRDTFPYCHIWRAAEATGAAQYIEFILVDDRPKAHCCVSLSNGVIHEIGPTVDASDGPPALRIKLSYIEDILKEPEKYIANPGLMDWDWLKLSRSAQ